jgi:hypothetical protein
MPCNMSKRITSILSVSIVNMLSMRNVCGGGTVINDGGKSRSKSTIKSMQRTIAALNTNMDQFYLPDVDNDEISEDEDGADASNCTNQTLTCQTKKKGKMG